MIINGWYFGLKENVAVQLYVVIERSEFGFFVWWHIKLRGLFIFKPIPVEEQQWY